MELFDLSRDIGEKDNLAAKMPGLVQSLDRERAAYLNSVDAETVTLTRRNYVGLLQGGWIENGRKRLAKLKAELAADPSNKQKAFRVDVSQNHVDFQDRQLKRSKRLIQMHEERGTADKNCENHYEKTVTLYPSPLPPRWSDGPGRQGAQLHPDLCRRPRLRGHLRADDGSRPQHQARLHPDTRAGKVGQFGRAVLLTAYAPSPTCTASASASRWGSPAKLQYRNVFDVLSPFQRPDGYDDETTMGEMLKSPGGTTSPRCSAKAPVP